MRAFDRTRSDPVQFSMDGDTFEAVPEIPAYVLAELVERFSTATTTDAAAQFKQMLSVIRQLLVPDSRDLFERRLSDGANPISLPQLQELITWLMGEVYGARPTPPSSPSPAPPGGDGQPSTDGAPPAESTSSPWRGPAI